MRRTLATIGAAALTLGIPAGLVLATTAPASACITVASRGTTPQSSCSGNGGGYTYAVTATPQTTGTGDLVTVQMTVTPPADGPFDGTSATQFSMDGGTCSGAFCTPDTAGTHTITGTYSAVTATGSTVSGTASTTITVFAPDHLVLHPSATTMTAGDVFSVGVQRVMADGTILDDVSNRATVTLGGALCPWGVCTATAWGKQLVVATVDGMTASTEVFVQTGPAVSLQVTPQTGAAWTSASPASFTVEAFDAGGNALADLTADSWFTIAPDGGCAGNTCTPASAGSHTVTATYKSLIGSVTLDVGSLIPSIAPTLPGGTVGTWYSESVLASGEATSAILGTSAPLPPGLSLASDGTLSGTPTTAGTYSFFVAASNAYGMENAETTITIAPGASSSKPVVSIGDASVLEGNSGRTPVQLTVSLSAPSSTPVRVSWHTVKGSALPRQDYVYAHGTLTIPAGQLTGQITVYVIGDTKVEKDETFTVVLGSPSGATLGTAQGTVTIANDD